MRLASSVLVVLAAAGAPATGNFEQAERFRKSEDVERGERVAKDQRRPAFVHRARGEGDAAVLGVTSMDPALLIGGTTFDVDAGGAELARELRASP